MEPKAFELASGDKIILGTGKRPAIQAQPARLGEQRGSDGVNRHVPIPAVIGRTEGPHGVRIFIQGDGTAEAWLNVDEVSYLIRAMAAAANAVGRANSAPPGDMTETFARVRALRLEHDSHTAHDPTCPFCTGAIT